MKRIIRGIFFAGVLALGVAGMLSRWDDVFVEKNVVAFLDPDCYSRMTRIAYGSPWSEVSRLHLFENAPQSVVPHTTAAMDLPLSVLAKIIGMDYAGAWISPLLGFLFLGVFVAWAWRRNYGWIALMLVATSPILAHGFSIGRPDHQSLIVLLCAVGLLAEVGIWRRMINVSSDSRESSESRLINDSNPTTPRAEGAKPVSHWIAAVVWPLALWTSLFEPLILLTCCLVARVVVLGRDAFPRERRDWAVVAVTLVLLVPALVDGLWRGIANPLPSETLEYFSAWAKTIGELQRPSWKLVFGWIGWLAPIFPALLLWRGVSNLVPVFRCSSDPVGRLIPDCPLGLRPNKKSGLNRILIALAVLFCIVLALTLWTARWGYFLPVVAAVCAPFALGNFPWKKSLHTLFVVSLWPVASTWDAKFGDEQMALRLEEREEACLLKDDVVPWITGISKADGIFESSTPKIVLAPWWLSPEIAYWGACRGSGSSVYCVAGSSHQSLPGIADTAKFYLSTTDAYALKILQARKVDYVLVDTAVERTLQTSLPLLGEKNATTACMVYRLAKGQNVPPFLRLVHRNQFFKLYRVSE